MDEITMERAFVISGSAMKNRVVIPAGDTKEADGKVYVHVSKEPNYMSNLLANRIANARVLSHTNVIETLTELRNDKLSAMLAKSMPLEQLDIFKPRKKKMTSGDKAELPASVQVMMPQQGDIPARPINVLLGSRGLCAPLYVELTAGNIIYLRQVCQWQIQTGSIKRRRFNKKPEQDPIDIDGALEELGVIENDFEIEPALAQYDHAQESWEFDGAGETEPAHDEHDSSQDDNASTPDSNLSGDLLEGDKATNPHLGGDLLESDNADMASTSLIERSVTRKLTEPARQSKLTNFFAKK